MAAIPSSGSLVATHDYYRSEHARSIYVVFIFYWQNWRMTPLMSLFHSCGLFLSALLLKGSVLISGRLGSTSSSGSCGSADYIGEVIPHHPGTKTCLCLSLSETFVSCSSNTHFHSSQDFQGKILATGGLPFSSQSRTSLACRTDPNIRSECL